MKKSLIALAVAGAFAAPAFAATENVDVYGKLHMSLSVVDDTSDAVNDVQITSNASRFGIKGAEDLGGGLSGIWQIESGVNLDEQNGNLSNRNSFVGLKGGFGTVLLGNHDTPLKLVGRAVDLFGDTLADSRNINGLGSDTRAQNVLVYVTPNMGGFGIAAAYTTDLNTAAITNPANLTGLDLAANNADRDGNSAYNVNATYNNGPIYVGIGFGDGDAHENAYIGQQLRAAVGLTFGPAKIVAQYDTMDGECRTGFATSSHPLVLAGLLVTGDRAQACGTDFESFMVGGAFTLGNVVLKANYIAGEYDGGAEPEQFTIGADYNLSKRTTVYAMYVAGEDMTRALGTGAGSSDRISGEVDEVSAVSLGLVHSF